MQVCCRSASTMLSWISRIRLVLSKITEGFKMLSQHKPAGLGALPSQCSLGMCGNDVCCMAQNNQYSDQWRWLLNATPVGYPPVTLVEIALDSWKSRQSTTHKVPTWWYLVTARRWLPGATSPDDQVHQPVPLPQFSGLKTWQAVVMARARNHGTEVAALPTPGWRFESSDESDMNRLLMMLLFLLVWLVTTDWWYLCQLILVTLLFSAKACITCQYQLTKDKCGNPTLSRWFWHTSGHLVRR